MPPELQDLYCSDLPTHPQPGLGPVLVTGASGYIGGRLVPELLARGYAVRVMVRRSSLDDHLRWPGAEVVVADALNLDSLRTAMKGIRVAYYLIHSLPLGPHHFESVDLRAAVNFRQAAEENGLGRIIYLGGLGDRRTTLSRHLKSRLQIALALFQGRVPVTILRAAIIIGSGSASYELIEHLVRKTRILPIPSWARTLCQPIAIRDVIKYLVGTLENPETKGRSFDIGGEDILSYEQMLRIHAAIIHKRMLFIRSPVSYVPLYAYMASLITPVPHAITLSLLESSNSEVVCQEDKIRKLIPFSTLSYREAVVRALSREVQDKISTRWSDAYPPAHELAIKLHEVQPRPRYIKTYSLSTTQSPALLFSAICQIGGREGWFNSNWMWKLRGWADRLLMGVGTSRGRKSHSRLHVNDVIDFWRIEELRQGRLLLLRAEMKIPGRAWLQFNIEPMQSGNRLSVTAFYDAPSLMARIYWYCFLPFHSIIFNGLICQIEARSRRLKGPGA